MNEKILVSRKNTAAAIDVSLRKVDQMIAKGELIAKKIGRRTLVVQSSIEKLAR